MRMRYLSVAWLLPLLFFAPSAEAARISFATDNCGTPPLLGLEFAVDADTNSLVVLTPGGVLCPTNTSFIPGAVSDGGTPLYGNVINSIQFFIASDVALPAIQIDSESDFSALLTLAPVSGGFLLTADFANATSLPGPIIVCPVGPVSVCIPDIQIGIHDLHEYLGDATFRVVAVNDVSVAEPATLSLVGLGLAAAARRRRITAAKGNAARGLSEPDIADRI